MIFNRNRFVVASLGGMIYDFALIFIWSISHITGLIAGFFTGFFLMCFIIIIVDFIKEKIKR